jgi:hypothetical protein
MRPVIPSSLRGLRAISYPLLAVALSAGVAAAQPAPPAPAPAQPAPPAPAPAAPVDPTAPAPDAQTPPPTDAPPAEAPPANDAEEPGQSSNGVLRLHIISTRNTYVPMGFDVFNAESQELIASGTGADEAIGQPAPTIELPPGVYKIVRARESVATNVDYATVRVVAGEEVDYVVVVDPDSLQFRGSGVVTGQLPTGTTIAGIRIALNAGGSLNFSQRANVVGGTSGLSGVAALFGNFSLVFDRDDHFLSVTSDLALSLSDGPVSSIASTADRWDAAALYAYNLGNPYIGPYGRASFSTRITPGYLYLENEDGGSVQVNVARPDGSVDEGTFGDDASQDGLRLRVAKPFAPIVLQEELGANLKAASIDLFLLKLTVATRLGFGFRQAFVNGLMVADGDTSGPTVDLFEVEDYNTLGPVIGANATVTFARWLFGAGNFGMMVPVKDTDEAGSNFGKRLLIDLSGTAGLKLPPITSFLFASFDYSLRLQKDGYISPDFQFDQTLMARMNVQLF